MVAESASPGARANAPASSSAENRGDPIVASELHPRMSVICSPTNEKGGLNAALRSH
jgi:hypothetical protein